MTAPIQRQFRPPEANIVPARAATPDSQPFSQALDLASSLLPQGQQAQAERFNEHGFFGQQDQAKPQSGVTEFVVSKVAIAAPSASMPSNATSPSTFFETAPRTFISQRTTEVASRSSAITAKAPARTAHQFLAAAPRLLSTSMQAKGDQPLTARAPNERGPSARFARLQPPTPRMVATPVTIAVGSGFLSEDELTDLKGRLLKLGHEDGLTDAAVLLNGVPIKPRRIVE